MDVLALIASAAIGYTWAFRRARCAGAQGAGAAWFFGIGLTVATVATVGPLAIYAPVLFWVRALQVLLLLYIAPFFLALGRPLTALTAASDNWAHRVQRFVSSAAGRLIGSLWPTSLALMATPWLLYFTPWYLASMSGPLAWLTQILLLLLGFGYFYARLQADPVPHRRTPLVAADYYAGLGRGWGPSMRVDQSIGAGILWILGDVFGVVFVMVLMRSLGGYERQRSAEVDAELESAPVAGSTLWWENDPQLRDRFTR